MTLAVGAAGVEGCALITTLVEAGEVQVPLETVKLYVPDARLLIVVLIPDPTTAPGLIVQFPAGKPLNTTLPVATEHVGWVIVPTTGADGAEGCASITTFADTGEIHPTALVTV